MSPDRHTFPTRGTIRGISTLPSPSPSHFFEPLVRTYRGFISLAQESAGGWAARLPGVPDVSPSVPIVQCRYVACVRGCLCFRTRNRCRGPGNAVRFVCALGGWRFVVEGALDPGVPHCPCPLPSPPHTNRLCKTIYLCDCLCGGPQGRAAEDEVRVCVASIHPAHFLARNVVLMPHVPPCTAQGTPQTQPVYS